VVSSSRVEMSNNGNWFPTFQDNVVDSPTRVNISKKNGNQFPNMFRQHNGLIFKNHNVQDSKVVSSSRTEMSKKNDNWFLTFPDHYIVSKYQELITQ
jgi:hypothetical protein